MNCLQCGEVCHCHPETLPLSLSEPDTAWRNELSARLSRYRARRKMRPPRYPSLQLPFAVRFDVGFEVQEDVQEDQFHTASTPNSFLTFSDRALALDGIGVTASFVPNTNASPARRLSETRTQDEPAERVGAKIIEFPHFAWEPPAPQKDELAEPVTDRPRILEVPDAPPTPPALGGITIEAVNCREDEKRPGIDIPLQGASLARRIAAGAIDALIILIASALFGLIFWKVAGVRPPLFQLLGLGAGIPCLFWAGFQYLLIVYAGTTPGVRAAGLRLACFDGTPAGKSLRRWRVLAAHLSAASLGMGYAWLFLDEDALCWHDRITHTYLAPRR